MKIVRKITAGHLLQTSIVNFPKFRDPAQAEKWKSGDAYVYGVASKVIRGVSQYGDWTGVEGEFHGVTENGEEIVAPKLILPEPVNGLLVSSVEKLLEKAKDDGVRFVKFGFKVWIVAQKRDITKYEYRTESLLEQAPSDPILELRRELAGRIPVLAEGAPEVKKLKAK